MVAIRVIGGDLANPDFMRLTDSFGIGGYRVKDPDGLRKALGTALAKNEPAGIEVPVAELPDLWQLIDMPKIRRSHSQAGNVTFRGNPAQLRC